MVGTRGLPWQVVATMRALPVDQAGRETMHSTAVAAEGHRSLEQPFQLFFELFLRLGLKFFLFGFDFLLDGILDHRTVIQGVFKAGVRTADMPVSYTHLLAHETRH